MGFWDKAQCGGSTIPLLRVGVFLLLRKKPVGFYLAKFQKLSILLALYFKGVFFVLFYWFILTETKGVHLLGREKKGKKSIKAKTQAKRGNQWDKLVVEAYPYLVMCCKFESKNSSKRETCKFLSCIF